VRVIAEAGVRWASGWALCEPMPFECTVVDLEGYGLNRAFTIVSRDRDTEHWATDDLAWDESTRLGRAEADLGDRERSSGAKAVLRPGALPGACRAAQRNHIGMGLRVFLRLERHFYATGVSWYEAKAQRIRGAIRATIGQPLHGLS